MGILRKILGVSSPGRESTPHTSDTKLGAIVDEAERLRKQGHTSAALAVTARAVAERSEPVLCHAHAQCLIAGGRPREALAWLERSKGVPASDLDTNIGWCLLQTGRAGEALAQLRHAAATNADDVVAHRALAALLHAAGQPRDAEFHARQALRVAPDDAEALVALGSILLRAGDLDGADEALNRAERAAPSASLWSIRAMLAAARRNFDDVIAYRRKAYEDREGGKGSDAFVPLATELMDAGRIDDAIALLERHLAAQPASYGYYVHAMALLKQGELRRGWHGYEFRWFTEAFLPMRLREGFATPTWIGQPAAGKTILLRAEQGLGDTLQFVRYATHVKATGATVLLEVQPELRRFAEQFPGVDRVVTADDAVPGHDFAVHLMSLPKVFDTEVDTIPASMPYLPVSAERKVRWPPRLAGLAGVRVGIAWAGNAQHLNDRQRSIALERLQALGTVSGVSFVSLQKGTREGEADTEAGAWLVARLGPEMEDLADAAAVIDALDLVICVDTALAHLAGALGKPVWVLLPTPADFRWMEGREDSPWYPTMRLFRQRVRGEWDEVIERVRAALEEVVRGGVVLPKVAEPSPVRLKAPANHLPRQAPGHRPGMSAVAETRHGILQYLPDEAEVGDALGWYGEWLEGQRELLVPWLTPGMTVLEDGAGVGAHALWLGAAVGGEGHLMLHEARAVHQRILRQNLPANRIGNVTVLREMEGLDELQLERLDWLRCSDAGRSVEVLSGGSETLWRLRPKVLAAVADEAQMMELSRRMREHGYRCWRIATPLYRASNFNRREGDIFGGGSALALLAIPEEADVESVPSDAVTELDGA